MPERWRRCSACKQDIALGAVHWVCSVSTCNRKRTGLVFCSVDCWEVHLPTERHREAWAVEARAPDRPEPAEPPPRTRRGAAKAEPKAGSARSASSSTQTPAASSPARPSHVVRRAGVEREAPRAETRSVGTAATGSPTVGTGVAPEDDEILVVASRLKAYVRARSGFNTSDRVLPVLSRALRAICDEAIENARRAEQLTVMGRDVPRE